MTVRLAPIEVLERATRGEPVDHEGVRGFVRSWLAGGATDPQMAAWCAVAAARGLPDDQVGALTAALIASGDRLELAGLGVTGDVHTTGAVGGAVAMVVPPLAAALGVRMAVVADAGRGHVGGAADALEGIPGYQTRLDLRTFLRQVRDVGCAVISQTDRLAPGERRFAVLRDQTATMAVPSLVAASVMSRALAGGAGAVVLDVAHGDGGFLPDADAARAAARLMARLAEPWARSVRWVLSAVDAPRGRMVGNALEVREAAWVLTGGGDAGVRRLATCLAGTLAEAAGVSDPGRGTAEASAALGDGRALAAAEGWVRAQGGDPAVWTEPGLLPQAPLRLEVVADADGVVQAMHARAVGEAVRRLGAGRLHPSQQVDHAVGLEILIAVGEPVAAGETVALVHARDEALGRACVAAVADALRIGPVAPEPVGPEVGGA